MSLVMSLLTMQYNVYSPWSHSDFVSEPTLTRGSWHINRNVLDEKETFTTVQEDV
jgi:hypothetical protein